MNVFSVIQILNCQVWDFFFTWVNIFSFKTRTAFELVCRVEMRAVSNSPCLLQALLQYLAFPYERGQKRVCYWLPTSGESPSSSAASPGATPSPFQKTQRCTPRPCSHSLTGSTWGAQQLVQFGIPALREPLDRGKDFSSTPAANSQGTSR